MKNDFKVDSVQLFEKLTCYCPLGKDYYHAEIEIVFEYDEEAFDFIEVHQEILNLNGKSMIVEDLVDRVYKIMIKYKPLMVSVEAKVESNVHCKVVVTKSGGNYSYD